MSDFYSLIEIPKKAKVVDISFLKNVDILEVEPDKASITEILSISNSTYVVLNINTIFNVLKMF